MTAALAAAGCGSDDEPTAAPDPAKLDPAEFTTRIDNPYWPMTPGARWVYRSEDERVVVTVLDRTRRLANGIEARVVHDRVTEGGAVVEDTYDWYAQDRDGSVWYLGEETKEYEDGKVVSTKGSWEAGVEGAEPGIVMKADPRVGDTYRQEHYPGEAEDAARILSLDEQAEVPFGHFRAVLMTKDYTPLEPKVLEYKLYAKGVGPVLVLTASGGTGREELVSFRPGG
jgi:hypothetical protein